MEKIKIAFFGTPEFSVPVLEGLIENYEVVLVVTQPDKPIGRKQKLKPSVIKEIALKHKIEVITPVKIRIDFANVINKEIDLIVTCAYGQIIPKEILEYPKLGCINVHASLLPKLRGGAPIHHAIIDGYQETGITIMYMSEKMDAGDIISQRKIKIIDSDNTGTLHDKLMILGRDLLLETLPSIIKGTNSRKVQNTEEITFAYNIKREEEKLDFNKTTKQLVNQIRGLYPWPLSYILIDNLETKVLEANISKEIRKGEVGTIIDVKDNEILIKTIDGVLAISKIKPFSKKEQTIKQFLNGKNKSELIGKKVI